MSRALTYAQTLVLLRHRLVEPTLRSNLERIRAVARASGLE